MEYKYRTLKSYDRLYDDYDISGNNAVETEYESMEDVNPDYAGNPLIEALPFCMSQEELAMSNLHTIRVPTEKELKTKPVERLLSSVSALDKLVIPMQWHYELQRELYWCMCRAYRIRRRAPGFSHGDIRRIFSCSQLMPRDASTSSYNTL